jgi:hypothetical protein
MTRIQQPNCPRQSQGCMSTLQPGRRRSQMQVLLFLRLRRLCVNAC